MTRPRAHVLEVPVVAMTCVGDQLAHWVAEAAVAQGVRYPSGRFPAICGATVLAASLCAAPGRLCPVCRLAGAESRDAGRSSTRDAGRRGKARRGFRPARP